MSDVFYSVDLPAMILAALAGFSGGIVGSLLLLKRQAMMADAMSHSILPGLALGYLAVGSISAIALFVGAFLSCIIAASLISFINIYSKLDKSMALGIVLTSMFAMGVALIELFVGGRVHLDTEHALYGALELTYWKDFGDIETMPQPIAILGCVTFTLILATLMSAKHIKMFLFDPEYYRISGFNPLYINTFILVATACIIVASFEAVGAILVLAVFICPPASIRMFTDNFEKQIIYSALLGAIICVIGYYIGAVTPLTLGFKNSISAAGSIAVLAGLILFLSIIFAPQHGLIVFKNTTSPN